MIATCSKCFVARVETKANCALEDGCLLQPIFLLVGPMPISGNIFRAEREVCAEPRVKALDTAAIST